MIVRQADSVPGSHVDMKGAEGVTFRMLLGEAEQAPTFCMRQFNLGPGGHTPRHTHDWEHEIYVLDGEGVIVADDGEKPIRPGHCALIPPGERHQFRNTGNGELKFLCLVPRSDG